MWQRIPLQHRVWRLLRGRKYPKLDAQCFLPPCHGWQQPQAQGTSPFGRYAFWQKFLEDIIKAMRDSHKIPKPVITNRHNIPKAKDLWEAMIIRRPLSRKDNPQYQRMQKIGEQKKRKKLLLKKRFKEFLCNQTKSLIERINRQLQGWNWKTSNWIRQQLPDIEVGTVHKFQGREMDVIATITRYRNRWLCLSP